MIYHLAEAIGMTFVILLLPWFVTLFSFLDVIFPLLMVSSSIWHVPLISSYFSSTPFPFSFG